MLELALYGFLMGSAMAAAYAFGALCGDVAELVALATLALRRLDALVEFHAPTTADEVPA